VKQKVSLILVVCLALGVAGLAEQSALDAFHSLTATQAPAEPASDAGLLDRVMAGEFDSGDRAALSEQLEALTAIANRDIAAYASAHGLPVARVRDAWYRAMANALAARIALDPASEPQLKNAQQILALFLTLDGAEEAQAQRQQIRAEMNADYGRRIAEPYNLPEDFVEFVVMNDHWSDGDWENDDWRAADDGGDAFADIALGSRDGLGETRIADMQALLIRLGYLKGKADGVFGPRTQAALLEFQLANGLPGTGICNARTLNALQADGAVARWDYGEDFWNSDNYDTPDTPDTADTPDTPDAPQGEDATARQDAADTPDTPQDSGSTGKKRAANTPDTPDTPKDQGSTGKKGAADTPDTPDTPKGKGSTGGKSAVDTPDTPD